MPSAAQSIESPVAGVGVHVRCSPVPLPVSESVSTPAPVVQPWVEVAELVAPLVAVDVALTAVVSPVVVVVELPGPSPVVVAPELWVAVLVPESPLLRELLGPRQAAKATPHKHQLAKRTEGVR